ncbi:MAG: potassium channel protein [Okeania sp. SIO2D1]|nr:potassium channel protein [Okeania sp. SIO2D1]
MTGFFQGLRQSLRRFFQLQTVEITIALLIVVSVVVAIFELSLPDASPLVRVFDQVNTFLTWVFIVELTLRFIIAPNKSRFFREYWLDILSVMPLMRVFRFTRVARLLRLLRLLRLFGLFKRNVCAFDHIIQRGALEYMIICGLIVLTVTFGTVALLAFEEKLNPQIGSVGEAFWFSFYSLFSGEPVPGPPSTLGGKLVITFIMLMNATIFAMFTGTVSAFMVDQLRMENRMTEWEDFQNHIIICGWNRKAEIIVQECQAAHPKEGVAMVIVAQLDEEQPVFDTNYRGQVRFLNDDFTKVPVLRQAGIDRASTCIILADQSHGRSEQDADARTILAALTTEKLNPEVYTCAELIHQEYGYHLDMGHVNNYVVSEEQNGFLLAQAALNPGLMVVFKELFTYKQGNKFYHLPIGKDWLGQSFFDLFVELKRSHNAILIAVYNHMGEFRINPDEYIFNSGDQIIVITEHELQI